MKKVNKNYPQFNIFHVFLNIIIWYNNINHSTIKMPQTIKTKNLGQVFTPLWIVDLILDKSKYKNNITNKYILEPSFGDGAFLSNIVKRYIKDAKNNNFSNNQIKDGLEKYIIGIEIDKIAYDKCISKLNQITSKYSIENINWSLYNQDALTFDYSKHKFDFIVGNPPYIRIHNLDDNTRNTLKQNYDFCKQGMIDIYLAFFEIGIKNLNKNGSLIYITPNMFLKNNSNKDFRNYLLFKNLISDIIDFGTLKIFEDINTYNCIIKLKNNKRSTKINLFLGAQGKIKKINNINSKNYINQKIIFTTKDDDKFLNEFKNKTPIQNIANVQYGFATLRDKIYIDSSENIKYKNNQKLCLFNNHIIEKDLVKPTVKGSRMFKNNQIKQIRILFPYKKINNKWIIIPEKEMAKKYPKTLQYLINNKQELQKRDIDKNALWYEYGRSQAVQSIHSKKIIVDILVNGKINTEIINEDTMLYSGIFITTNTNKLLNRISEELKKEKFLKYARIMGKDMQGGYKSINTKIIKNYCI